MKRVLLVLSGILTTLVPAVAPATVVTQSYAFTATDFDFAFGGPGPAPFDPATGIVTVTFDDAVDQQDVTTGVRLDDFNFAVDTIDAVPGYSFSVADNLLFVGTVCRCGSGGVTAIGPNADNFLLGINDPAGQPAFALFGYSQAAFPDIAIANRGSVSAVPEPAAWTLMILGFGAIGDALRRRGVAPIPALS